jgi:hypothetical protein
MENYKLLKLLLGHRALGQKAIYYTEQNNEQESIKADDEMQEIESTIMSELGLELDSYGNVLADIEAMDMLKDDALEVEYEKVNDSTRDIAIRCVDRLVKEGYVKDCTGTNDTTEFSVQDIIQEEINKNDRFIEETCPKCDQHPYSETDRHCPVCFNEITKIAELKAEIKDEKYYSKEMIKKLKAELSQGDK